MVAAIAPSASEPELLEASLASFTEASKQLLGERALLRRIDSKYVVHASRLVELVSALRGEYAALRVSTGACATYRSLYFDSPDLQCFHDHRRGRRIRHKIRIRHYDERGLSFLEVKTKRNDVVTDKQRLELPPGAEHIGARELAFLRTHAGTLAESLAPVLRIDYRRISLIGLHANERVTIDLDLEVAALDGTRHSLGPLTVIEIKQGTFSLDAPVMRALAAAGHREQSLSKYIAAVARLRPEERMNRLLPSLRAAEKVTQ